MAQLPRATLGQEDDSEASLNSEDSAVDTEGTSALVTAAEQQRTRACLFVEMI
jgi:hypothetical protein